LNHRDTEDAERKIKPHKKVRKTANKQNNLAKKDAESIRQAIEDTYGYDVQVRKFGTDSFDIIFQNYEWLSNIRELYRVKFNLRTEFSSRLDTGEYFVRVKPRY